MAFIYSARLAETKANLSVSSSVISMTTYPRIHMFSLDLSDTSGSFKSGSLGLSLKDFPIRVSVTQIEEDTDLLPQRFSSELRHILQKTRDRLGKPELRWGVKVDMPSQVGPHTGLGTTTQVTGAAALCAAKTVGVDFNFVDLYNLGIGYASALGLTLLFNPGFILENGYRISTQEEGGCKMYPELYDVYQIPVGSVLNIADTGWYLVVALPTDEQSLSGEIEDNFWHKVLPDDLNSTYITTYNVLEKIIPHLVTDEYEEFLQGMKFVTNKGIKPLEESIQNPKTKRALEIMRKKYGFAAISSLGPSIYSFSKAMPTDDEIRKLNSSCKDFTIHVTALGEKKE